MLKRNVLIFHTGALGDFVLTWPLALGLARLHPQSRVVYVTHPGKGHLAEKTLGLESASIEAGWHHLLGEARRLPAASLRLLEGAHSIFSFISTGDDDWSKAVRGLNPQAALLCLNPTPPPGFAAPHADWLAGQLASVPAAAEAMRQMIQSIRERGLCHQSRTASAVVVHPGSGSPAKCWPVERFAQLAAALAQMGRPVRFVLGEAELDRWPPARIGILEQTADLVRPADYLGLLAAFTETALYIGNDSGPTHLAAMLGIPSVALFGPSNPAVWAPIGRAVTLLHRPRLEDLTAEEVLGAAKGILK